MFGTPKQQQVKITTGVATSGLCPPDREKGTPGDLHLDLRSCHVFIREESGWVHLGMVVPTEANGMSQARAPRLGGRIG